MLWEPMAVPGEFEQSPVKMVEVGLVERICRMMLRIVPMLWLYRGEPLLARFGLSWLRVFTDIEGSYRLANQLLTYAPEMDYAAWIEKYGRLTDGDRMSMRAAMKRPRAWPLFTVAVFAGDENGRRLAESVDSVFSQVYQHWQLLLFIDSSSLDGVAPPACGRSDDERVEHVCSIGEAHSPESMQNLLSRVKGDYVMLLKPGDLLPAHALFALASAAGEDERADIVYGDEDEIGAGGNPGKPWFKPDWNLDLFYSQNYLARSAVYRTSLVRAVGGFCTAWPQALDYDLALRCIRGTTPALIRHVPSVLCRRPDIRASIGFFDGEWGATNEAAVAALTRHFESASGVRVSSGAEHGTFRVRYPLPPSPPKATLIIPTRDGYRVLRRCIDSIRECTSYPDWEIIVVDNQSADPSTIAYLAELTRDPQIRVLHYDYPFNHSAINNFAVAHATGDIIGLINDDVEVISPDWLGEMISHAVRPEIGVVGAKLYYDDDRIQHAGVVLGLGGIAGHGHKFFPREAGGYFSRLRAVQQVSAVTAACMVLRRAVYEQVGGMDEKHLAVTFNDVDLCLRIRELGFGILWTPYAELYHHESFSRGEDNTREKRKRFRREAAYMKKKWGEMLKHDPFYNPNLTLQREDFSLAPVPRRHAPDRPVFTGRGPSDKKYCV